MRWGIAGLAALMLAGCGAQGDSDAPPSAQHSIDPATGETRMTLPHKGAAATLRAGPGVPVHLPDGLTLFPGARVENNARFTGPDGESSLITFAADAPATAVIAHYRGQAEAAGFAIALEHEAAGSLILIAERARDRAKLSVNATGAAGEGTGGGTTTTGQLALTTSPQD